MTAEASQEGPLGAAAAAAAEGGPSSAAPPRALAQNCKVQLSQLSKITGIQDPPSLQEALDAADGYLMQAVDFLIGSHAKKLDGEAVAEELCGCKCDVTSPVDGAQYLKTLLTTRPSRDQNFQESNSAANGTHESSSAESATHSKRRRREVWGDPVASSDWRRTADWPVGLKNIGNTCWFSAVIQSLFQLPEFRRLVLNYSVPDKKKKNIAFMKELQRLFALMLGTFQKFVDPTSAVELLRGAFRTPEEQQQDVSEFTHKLLDWLEDAFQLMVNANSSRDKSDNPMVQLFYGTYLMEGIHEGKAFSKIEAFGQYPLQVNSYKNLYECLEGAMVEKETGTSPSQSVKYKQECWFTKLPPVLTFELSRFEFNQSLGQPEKIHNKLEFPKIIYMDRFLYGNKELVQSKREEIKKMKDQIMVLQQKLERYMKYGSGAARFPLPDMLQYMFEFASARPSTDAPAEVQEECQTSETPPTPSRVEVNEPEKAERAAASAPAVYPQGQANSPLRMSRCPSEVPEHPTPHVISEAEINLVMSCLQRWRREVEQDIADLKNSISLLHEAIDKMFSEAQLQQVPYHLHAVLVHEGQANAGHYWAYIYNQPRKKWLKYNDISVTESSWEELERDSFGGLRNASAYCLMYINRQLPHFAEGPGEGQMQKEVEALPLELQYYIQEDNQRLEAVAAAAAAEGLFSDPGTNSSGSSEASLSSLSSEHAMLTTEEAVLTIQKTTIIYEKDCVEAALEKAFHEEYFRLYSLSMETPTPQNDPRLQHILVYLLQNKAPKQVVERTLLEQFADKNLSYDERSISIMKVARAKLKEIGPDQVDMEEYKKWHEDYSLFRKVSVYLLTGLELYQNEQYGEALSYLIHAYQNNAALQMKGPKRGADVSLISLYTRKCLVMLNDAAATLLDSSNPRHMDEGVSLLKNLIIPCIHLLARSNPSQVELEAIDVMRGDWFDYMEKDMTEDLRLQLGDLLAQLFDSSSVGVVLREPPKIRPNLPYDLCSRFAAVMESIHGTSAVAVK